jgi:hypothetical protein
VYWLDDRAFVIDYRLKSFFVAAETLRYRFANMLVAGLLVAEVRMKEQLLLVQVLFRRES